jgi:hypothetical protein
MTKSVVKLRSTDGTTIALEVTGSGRSVVLIGGAFNDLRDGVRLTLSASPHPLELVGPPPTYEDGSVQLIYRPCSDNGGQS